MERVERLVQLEASSPSTLRRWDKVEKGKAHGVQGFTKGSTHGTLYSQPLQLC